MAVTILSPKEHKATRKETWGSLQQNPLLPTPYPFINLKRKWANNTNLNPHRTRNWQVQGMGWWACKTLRATRPHSLLFTLSLQMNGLSFYLLNKVFPHLTQTKRWRGESSSLKSISPHCILLKNLFLRKTFLFISLMSYHCEIHPPTPQPQSVGKLLHQLYTPPSDLQPPRANPVLGLTQFWGSISVQFCSTHTHSVLVWVIQTVHLNLTCSTQGYSRLPPCPSHTPSDLPPLWSRFC